MMTGEIDVHKDQNSLILKKSKTSETLELLFSIFFYLVFFVGPTIYFLSVKGFNSLFEFEVFIAFIIFFLLSIIFIVYNIKRVKAKYKPFVLHQTDNIVLINNEAFCSIADLQPVTIQRMTDGDGASSYNVGISSKYKFYPLCLDQGQEDAKKIASIIANFFCTEVEMKDGTMIFP